jgi:hypothetical protein
MFYSRAKVALGIDRSSTQAADRAVKPAEELAIRQRTRLAAAVAAQPHAVIGVVQYWLGTSSSEGSSHVSN